MLGEARPAQARLDTQVRNPQLLELLHACNPRIHCVVSRRATPVSRRLVEVAATPYEGVTVSG